MSTLTFASASVVKMRPAMPGWSGTPSSVTRASPVECVTAVMSGCSTVSSSPTTTVPGRSWKLDRQWMRTPWLRAYSTRAQLQDARAGRRHLEHLLERDDRQLARLGHDPRVGGEDAVDVGVDLADVGADRRGERDGGRVRAAAAERRDVLARSTRPGSRRRARSRPASSASRMRSARTSRMRAFVWEVSVTIPACEPVREMARCPRSLMAIAHSAHETRSPVERSMSISRGSGFGGDLERVGDQPVGLLAARARARRRRRSPASCFSTIRSAARLRRSASATDVPPNFITTVCPRHGRSRIGSGGAAAAARARRRC